MAEHSLPVRIATLGALGRSPFAPGTVGTVAAGVPCAYLSSFLPGWAAALLLAAVLFLGRYASECAEKELGRHDPREVVIDELAGFLVTMIGLPFTVESLVLGIAAFRLFDIWKPWPVSVLDEKIKGGIGIMLDDVGAGILANILVRIILALVH